MSIGATDRISPHRGLERHRAAPHRGDPVEHLHAGRDRDQHGGEHEVDLAAQRHAHGEHVVGPDDERQERDRGGGVHHRLVAEQRLAAEGRDDLADHAEGGQDHDVDLGVPEEPEHVLVQDGVAAGGRVEEARAEVAVGQHHGDGRGQHRHHGQQQERGRVRACSGWSR
ncbi:hypothetical protein G6F40_014968 [Rhizopus arrhizus]|nr:hypothetical protein G6F40_014968 [Rhizopus arrhizus]